MIRLSMMARQTAAASMGNAIERAFRLRLDGVDIHLSGLSRQHDDLLKLKQACWRRGLTIGYAGGGTFVGPPAQREQRLNQGRQDVDAAALLGAQFLRVFARHPWPATATAQEALWVPMIASFQELCDYAAGRGVNVALQNHDNSSFAMTAAQVLRILDEVGRPNFGFLMDTGQWLGAIGSHPRGEYDATVDLYRDYLEPTAQHAVYVRAKIYKIDAGHEEWIDYPRVLALLRAVDYNGTIGLVFELGDRNAGDEATCIELAVRHLRRVIADAG